MVDSSSSGSLCLFVITPNGIVEYPLPRAGRVTIGRGTGNAIRLDDQSVSRRHAVLEIGETLSIEDLGAANGTHIQRARQGDSAVETEHLRPVRSETTGIALGDRIVLGVVHAVIRRTRSKTAVNGTDEHVVLDPQMVALYAQVERAAASRVSILIRGETGVGKEMVARRVHAGSPRHRGPFVAINCAAFSESLLEAELFGAEKGAYTGATHSRPGLFETAEQGTLFLDEIGELAPAMQAKLLRVLEERKVLRVGARLPRDIDVRFVAATNRDLRSAAEQNAFRADLFFRLAGIVLEIPPLRDRPTEIEPLARLLLERARRDLERPPLELGDDAIEALRRYGWPGNVRELKNAMDHAAVLCPGSRVGQEHLPAAVTGTITRSASPPARTAVRQVNLDSSEFMDAAGSKATLPPAADAFENAVKALDRERIVAALEQCHGNQTRAAELLGISRRTLIGRLNEYAVGRPRKR